VWGPVMYEMTGPHVSFVASSACAAGQRTRTNRRCRAEARQQTHCPVGPSAAVRSEDRPTSSGPGAVHRLPTRRSEDSVRLGPSSPSNPKVFRFRPALESSVARRPEGHLTSIGPWSPRHPAIRRPPGPVRPLDPPAVVIHRDFHNRCIVGIHTAADPRVCVGLAPRIEPPDGPRANGSSDPITRFELRPQAPVSRASRLLGSPFGAGVPRCDGRISTAPETPAQGLPEKKFKIFPAVHRRGVVIPRKGPVVHQFAHVLITRLWTTGPPVALPGRPTSSRPDPIAFARPGVAGGAPERPAGGRS